MTEQNFDTTYVVLLWGIKDNLNHKINASLKNQTQSLSQSPLGGY